MFVLRTLSGLGAAGARGVATGPQGNVVVGARGVAGNADTGNEVHGNRGAYYGKSRGQWTAFDGATGEGGGQQTHQLRQSSLGMHRGGFRPR